VAVSLGNSYRPAAAVGDVRISFNEYDQMEADPTRVPDYTFVGTDGKPLDGITLQAARANSPKIRTFNVGSTGDINIVLSNGQTFTSGAVLLHMFKDPVALTRQGDNLFSGMNTAGPYNGLFAASNISGLTPATGGLGVINGGSLELSNVDLGEEFSSMIITQRAFQAGSRLISTADQMLEEAVNLKR
jgi:flagellar hook protein FlgE